MKAERAIPVRILWFGLKFLVLVGALVSLWWLVLMQYYGWLLGQVTAGTLINVFGLSVEAMRVQLDGYFNTKSLILLTIDGRQGGIPLAGLVTNMPPYWALVLATGALHWRRRLFALLVGTLILFVTHYAFCLLIMVFGRTMAQAPQLPMALGEFFITLPFVLWIVLAGWPKIAAYVYGKRRDPVAEVK